MRYQTICATITLLLTSSAAAADSLVLPRVEPVRLKSYARLDTMARDETSGIVKSRKYKDLFWVHNDSGDRPAVYSVHSDGTMYESHRYKAKTGTAIPDAVNFDWEDITADDAGNLIIADFGNNCQCRNDLLLYVINEPDPSQERTTVKQRIFFRYPDQTEFPAPADNINFDAEAVFHANGKAHVLSKNRTNTLTKLYRLDRTEPFVVNVLTLVDTFDIGGKVTGADASPDGSRLAVITYEALWLFETQQPGEWFSGTVSWLPYKAEQTEAVCFDGDGQVIITDEEGGRMYRVALDRMHKVRDPLKRTQPTAVDMQ